MIVFAVLFSIFSLSLSSCGEKDGAGDPEGGESSFTFTLRGVTSTIVLGEVHICQDGYLQINGEDPTGGMVTVGLSEILIGETRYVCSDDFIETCVEDGGLLITAGDANSVYVAISGSATRTSKTEITASGILRDVGDMQEYPFTLTANAGLFFPYNCR